ncbi:MAG: dTDP-4-dehydrorhamnose reductase [Sulfurovum sp.]|nr:MAG: dTDP-4-dehydrorhamnose reductase [Sulfurovum sp.]
MHNILVTGSKGQLGSEIRELSVEYQDVFYFTDRNELDITNKDAVDGFCIQNNIEVIINCAAYTAVDKAEEDEANADRINHLAVKSLAEISKEKNIKLIHISTDYVFDGENYKPYVEDDKVNPNGIYGKTKLDGELALQEIDPNNTIIIRTSWVYSSFGANFVKTMLRLGKERDALGVIFDQVGTPTYARDLANTILEIIPQLNNDNVEIYHYSNEGVCSWYDFAKTIFELSNTDCKVSPIETKEYPTPATRPHYSLLNKSKIKKEYNIAIPYWKDSLDTCLIKMQERK